MGLINCHNSGFWKRSRIWVESLAGWACGKGYSSPGEVVETLVKNKTMILIKLLNWVIESTEGQDQSVGVAETWKKLLIGVDWHVWD